MTADRNADHVLRDLSEVVLGEEPLDAILELVCFHACSEISHADEVSVTVKDERGFRTAAHTNERVKQVDEQQYELEEGPCVDAARTGEVLHIAAMAQEDRWPAYAPRAARAGVGSSLSVPLEVQERAFGALNVYSWSEGAFDDEDQRAGERFAKRAATLVANASTLAAKEQLATQLRDAVASREVIGKAIGILMERETITDDEAFGMLRVASQNANVKLRDIAEQLLDATKRKAKPRAGGDASV